MKIVDFALDLPYVVNEGQVTKIQNEAECSRNEATIQDYRENWKWKRRSFSLETRCVTALFSRLFKSFDTNDCKKIVVECIDEASCGQVKNLLGVLHVQVQFDYKTFHTLDNNQKKRVALDLLMEGIERIALDRNWSMEPFKATCDEIIKLDYINEWIWGKSARNNETEATAKVLLQHEVKKVDISVIVFDKENNEIHREVVIAEEPDEFAYAKHLSDIKWADGNTVVLTGSAGDEFCSVVAVIK